MAFRPPVRPAWRSAVAGLILLSLATGCFGKAQPAANNNSPGPGATGALRPDPALAGAGDPLFPELGNGGYDISHYDLDLTWAQSSRTLSGTVTITARALRDLSTFDLDMTGMFVDRMTVDAAPARGARVGAELVVGPAHQIRAKSIFTVAVTYHGRPNSVPYKGGRSTGVLGWQETERTIFVSQEPFGAYGWFPCSDHPSDKASYSIHITTPSALTVIAGGKRTERKPVGANTRWTYEDGTPMATYLVALAIGSYVTTTDTGPNNLPITYAYFAADKAKALPLLRKSPAQIRYFEARFGPYPFDTYGVLATDVADDQTMETQSMVTLGRGLATDTSTSYPKGIGEAIMAHELAHQWFGDSVTPARWTDMWLNEGWAQYAQAMYEADVLGQPLAAKMADYRRGDAQARKKWGPPGHPKPQTISEAQVYYGPAVMLNGLRSQMGDSAFFAMARAWTHDNRGTSRTRADFTGYVNRFAKRDLSAYIAAWLDSRTQPAN